MPDETRIEFLKRMMADPDLVADFPDSADRFLHADAEWRNAGTEKTAATVLKVDTARRLVYGWFSVIEERGATVVDYDDDVIRAGALLDAAHEFLLESRAGKLMHRGKRVADLVESVVFTKDVQAALGIDLGVVGWFGAMKIRDDELWKRVLAGEFQAFSIGGVSRRREI